MAKRLKVSPARNSTCPIAATLDLVGDKWSLLIVRDIALFDKHRNKDFQEGAENFPTNILADRLRRLTNDGILEKRLYQERPPRYEYHLSAAGQSLVPVLGAMAQWACEYVPGVKLPKRASGKSSGRPRKRS